MEQPVTGSNQAEAVWLSRGNRNDDDHHDNLPLPSTFVSEMLVVVFAASHLLWLHTILLQKLPILSSHDAY